MTPREMKALRRRFNEEVDRRHDLDAIDDIVANEFVDHVSVPGLPSGVEGLKQRHSALFAAFPDFEISIEDMVAEDDKVVARLTVRGTHRGELFGIEPTGKSMSYEGDRHHARHRRSDCRALGRFRSLESHAAAGCRSRSRNRRLNNRPLNRAAQLRPVLHS